jgi:uncharacterized protein with HEPN domain
MPRDEDYLADIVEAAGLVQTYAEGLTRAALEQDPKSRDALLHRLLVIGEAASKLSDGFRASRPDVPWRQMIGMRNVIVHQYGFVDLDVVWLAATRDVPELVRLLTGGAP